VWYDDYERELNAEQDSISEAFLPSNYQRHHGTAHTSNCEERLFYTYANFVNEARAAVNNSTASKRSSEKRGINE
jgi:hypothetical protein